MKPFQEENRMEENKKEGDGREEEKRGNRRIKKGSRRQEKMGKEDREGENKNENVEDATNSTDFRSTKNFPTFWTYFTLSR